MPLKRHIFQIYKKQKKGLFAAKKVVIIFPKPKRWRLKLRHQLHSAR